MSDEQDKWTVRDVLWGGVILAVGTLIVTLAVLAMRNSVPVYFWGLGMFIGPVFVVLGLNSIYKGARSGRRENRQPHEEPPMAVISFLVFAIGLISHVRVLLFFGTRNAEIASDLGTARCWSPLL